MASAGGVPYRMPTGSESLSRLKGIETLRSLLSENTVKVRKALPV